jgi:hypothetical protein
MADGQVQAGMNNRDDDAAVSNHGRPSAGRRDGDIHSSLSHVRRAATSSHVNYLPRQPSRSSPRGQSRAPTASASGRLPDQVRACIQLPVPVRQATPGWRHLHGPASRSAPIAAWLWVVPMSFWECLGSNFYNLYDRNWAAQCSPIIFESVTLVDCS